MMMMKKLHYCIISLMAMLTMIKYDSSDNDDGNDYDNCGN